MRQRLSGTLLVVGVTISRLDDAAVTVVWYAGSEVAVHEAHLAHAEEA
jgi:hypothetical protein